jgi:hypothetical protein
VGCTSLVLRGCYWAPSGVRPVQGLKHARVTWTSSDTRHKVELLWTTIRCSSQQVGSCLEIYQNYSTKWLQHSNSSLRCCPSLSLCILALIRLKLMHCLGGGNGPIIYTLARVVSNTKKPLINPNLGLLHAWLHKYSALTVMCQMVSTIAQFNIYNQYNTNQINSQISVL